MSWNSGKKKKIFFSPLSVEKCVQFIWQIVDWTENTEKMNESRWNESFIKCHLIPWINWIPLIEGKNLYKNYTFYYDGP